MSLTGWHRPEPQHVGTQIPLGVGLVQAFTGAVAEPLGTSNLDTALLWDREDGGVPETGSPAVVVHQQVGDDLAALQIETVEVRQPEVAARMAPPSRAL
jgi:hypothetical protein